MKTQQLLLVAIILIPLHIVEQLLFGIDELYELQAMVRGAVSLFPDPEHGAVVLVGALVVFVLLLCYGFMVGGVPRLLAAGFFGLEFMGESHHLIKTIVRGSYFPGAVTAVALVVLGALILTAIRRETRHAAVAREATLVPSALAGSQP